jgi:hypothetical protein
MAPPSIRLSIQTLPTKKEGSNPKSRKWDFSTRHLPLLTVGGGGGVEHWGGAGVGAVPRGGGGRGGGQARCPGGAVGRSWPAGGARSRKTGEAGALCRVLDRLKLSKSIQTRSKFFK